MLKVGTTLSARPVLLAIAALQPLQSPVEKAMAGTLSCRSSPIPRTTDQYRWTRLSWSQHLCCMHPMCRKTQACRQTKNCQEWPLFGCKEFLQCTDVPALCPELSLTPVPLLQSQGPYEYIAQEEPGRSRLVPRLWCGQPNLGVSQRHNSDQYDYSLKCSHTSKSKGLHPLTFPAGQSSFASCPIL